MTQVEVRVIEKESWHKKGGRESFKRPITIEALYSTRTKKYAVDLTEEELKTYGDRLGVNLSLDFNVNKPHEFYCSAQGKVKLENNTMIFNTDNPLEAIKVGIMKASPFVANSLKEYEEGMYPEATHYIFSEDEEMAVKAKKVEINNACIVAAAKMSTEEKINIAICLGDKPLKGRSQNFVDVAIDDIIKEKPVDFLTYAKKDKKENHIKATVLDAIRMNILTKEGPAICYMGDTIGYGIEEAVSWFKDPNNQILKTSILEKLNK
jgi:hypothetical protein